MTGLISKTVVASEAARISALIRTCDLTSPVPNLGRWKVRDVVAHLGGVHRWATRIVTSRSMDGPSFTKSKLDGPELCDWFDEGATELVDAFRTNPSDEPCPNFNPGSAKTVGWWLRRQTHETIVHRWDIERALDCTSPLDPVLAADGIDEFFDVFVRRRGKQTLTAPLLVSSTKPARTWTLTLADKPGRLNVDVGHIGQTAAEVSGSPDQLLLALWGRLNATQAELTTTGDASVAHSFIPLD